ncbi:hypothetical protein Fot_19352 [Forsythia ovata]|uniref:Uncharacterized protein n=1 Tax=Forsythia ovata TaxID=205694 RepID=A0ABD1VKT0_9LAMI
MLIYLDLPGGGGIEVQNAPRSWRMRSSTPEEGSSRPCLALRESSVSSMPFLGPTISLLLPTIAFLLPDRLKFFDEDTGPVGSRTEGASAVISGCQRNKGRDAHHYLWCLRDGNLQNRRST